MVNYPDYMTIRIELSSLLPRILNEALRGRLTRSLIRKREDPWLDGILYTVAV
jgi:hypothetical protein